MRLVEAAERVDFLGAVEVDAVDHVDDIAEQVAGDHSAVQSAACPTAPKRGSIGSR